MPLRVRIRKRTDDTLPSDLIGSGGTVLGLMGSGAYIGERDTDPIIVVAVDGKHVELLWTEKLVTFKGQPILARVVR